MSPITLKKKGSILLAKGIDASMPGEYLEDQFAINSINFELIEGVLVKRKGFDLLGDIAGGTQLEIMNGIVFRREDADTNVRVTQQYIEKYVPGTNTWDDISGTVLTGSTSDLVSLATPVLSGQPILVITNGIDAVRKWTATGDTSELGGSAPKCKYLQEYEGYLLAANITGGVDDAQRIDWCDTDNAENWTTGNSGSKVLIEDNGDITGLNLFGAYVCVHKETSIYLGYLVNTTNIFRFDRKSTGAGTVANRTIVNLPTGEQIFLAIDGLRIFNGITAPLIDAPINDEIRRTLNKTYAFKSWAVLVKEKDEVWVGIPTGSETVAQTIFKFNYVNRTVYKNTLSNANSGWIGSSDDSITWDAFPGTWDSATTRWNDTALNADASVINIGLSTGYTLKSSSLATDDNDADINAFYDSKDFQDTQEGVCRFSELQLWAKGSGTVTVQYSIDEGSTWVALTGSPVTLGGEFPQFDAPQMLYFDVVASKIRFRFSNNTDTDTLSIKQFIVGYKVVGFRR